MLNKYSKLLILLLSSVAITACIGGNTDSGSSSSTAAAPTLASNTAIPPAVSSQAKDEALVKGGDSTSATTTLADSTNINSSDNSSITADAASLGSTDNLIGVISYNVKGYINHQNPPGGWNDTTNRGKLIGAINAQIKTQNNKIDFIGLVQTNEKFAPDGKTPISNITHLDGQLAPVAGIRWAGVYSSCYYDGNQIVYNSNKWRLMAPGPFSNGFKGCGPTADNRPYLMALFQNIASPNDKKVLFISVHFPHRDGNWSGSATDLNRTFNGDLNRILTANNLNAANVRIIMAGDMNEIGQNFYSLGSTFISLFKGSNKSGLSSNIPTCCNGGGDQFDKVYANNSNVEQTFSFDIVGGSNEIFEQHKGVYALLNPIQ
ncbi:MAG: hypothetical protein K0R14_1987 [Burkholderiales bacterium]|jgi:hypothetical protein|nr:hypothetical protein [Burkholderiales bacterium]